MRILVVDDTKLERERLRMLLVKLGHEVIMAGNGVEAIESYAVGKPDIVLLDVVMPVMDGLETARRIRAMDAEWTPILFLSSNTEPEDIAAGIDAGGDDYLNKPVNSVVLGAKLLAMQRIASMKSVLAQVTVPEVKQEIVGVAEVDDVSGFASATAGQRTLTREFTRCSRSSQPISLILFCVDHYDQIVSQHGQGIGNQCLKKLSVALQTNASRMTDFGFRYAENIFAVILPDTPMTGGMRVAERVRSTIHELDHLSADLHPADTAFLQFSISAGIASAIPRKGEESQLLVSGADSMLELSMEEGGDRVHAAAVSVPFRLTTRELECLQWSALGKTSWEISGILEISEAAVNFHMANIRAKFDVTSRRQAVAMAIRYGLIRAA